MTVVNSTNQEGMPPYQNQQLAVVDTINGQFKDTSSRQIPANNIGFSLGQSVVPDLMRVYESLTQSSTPHSKSDENSSAKPSSDDQFANQKPYTAPRNHNQAQEEGQQPYQANNHQSAHNPRFHQQPEHQQQQQHFQNNVQQQQQQQQHSHGQYQHLLQQQDNTYNHSIQRPQKQDTFINRTVQPTQNYHENDKSVTNPIYLTNHTTPSHVYNTQPSQNPTAYNFANSSADQETISRKRTAENDETKSGNDSRTAVKSRKKVVGDSRWSKRFTWPDALHRDFVSAIFDVGLKHASPSAILEHMTPNNKITSERIKSHLQKYRLHRTKSKREFMESYDLALNKFKRNGLNGNLPTSEQPSQNLSLGEVAAHLSFTTMSLDVSGIHANAAPTGHHVSHKQPTITTHQGGLKLPQLTEEEKRSPLGASMGYLLGLFVSLTQQISLQRGSKQDVNINRNGIHDGNFHMQGQLPRHDTQVNRHQSQHQPKEMMHQRVPIGHPDPRPTLYNNPNTISPQEWTPPQSNINVHHPQKHHFQQTITENQHAQHQQWSKPSKNNAVKDTTEPAPPTRTFPNVEESNKMKREMQNQMALQKNFRALKQQELNKCTNQAQIQGEQSGTAARASTGNVPGTQSAAEGKKDQEEQGASNKLKSDSENIADANSRKPATIWEGAEHGVDNFWNVDMVDDQLFEFLMTD